MQDCGEDDDPVSLACESLARETFAEEGFVIIEGILDRATCARLNARLEAVLRGQCDGAFRKADKMPKRLLNEGRTKPGKVPPPLGGPSKQTLQVINIWKADSEFARVVRSPQLGQAVAALGGWAAGARVANDQVWAKVRER